MTTLIDNPLLDLSGPPRFQAIKPEHIEPVVRQRIAEVEALIERLVTRAEPPTWATLVEPLDAAFESLERAWGPVEHLNSTMNTDALREVYRATKPLLAEHEARVGQDARLFRAYEAVRARADQDGLSSVQKKVLDEVLRDFRLAGVALETEAQKARFREIKVELSKLESRFSDNVVDVTRAFRMVVEDAKDLAGLPERVIAAARQQALDDDAQAPEARWTFTLHAPSVQPFLQYAESRALRQRLYRGFTTRATEGEQDNGPLMSRILELRRELAQLLGYRNFAEVSLATKMAPSPEKVVDFLRDLAAKSKPFGVRDRAELDEYARRRDGLTQLEAWDFAFYRERLRQERYSFSDEEVRQYFPLERALGGLFDVLQRLYGIKMSSASGFETWHSDVRLLEVKDESGDLLGHMFLDLFARDGKKPGAWMGGCIDRRRRKGDLQRPIAYLVCNFAPPLGTSPSMLRHDEVRTLFHECGHALHHVLTQVDVRQVSGINRVPWDGVELPSQFHENWVWHEDSLALLAGHVDTGAPLPKELLSRMLAAKNFQSGADMLRQLEFALFDLTLHTSFDPAGKKTVHDVIEGVRDEVAVLRPPAWNRFENAFTHIFAGGYAAGYYSYKWAEVLAADAFSRFEEEGIFSRDAGQAFRDTVLGRGGSEDLMELFVRFRGREPSAEPLLRQSGLVPA